jgi:hypothetical protein
MTDTLSLDDAVSLLGSPEPDETPAEAAPVEAAKPDEAPLEGEQQIEGDDQSPDDPDAPETASEGEGEEVEAAQPPIEPPHFWSADAKARFAELPYELQLVVQENEKAGSKATTQKLEEATLARKAADAKAEALAGLAERIEAAAEQAETTFASRWQGMDQAAWLKLSNDDPNQYVQLKALHDAEQQAVQQARSAKDAAEQVRQEQWLAEENERLKTYAPELADPVKGSANRKAVAEYLISQGASEQDLEGISAAVTALAYKAMLYDKGVSGLKSRPTPTKPALKPTAPAGKTLTQSEAETAARRLGQTGDVDDAVRLMQLRRKTG